MSSPAKNKMPKATREKGTDETASHRLLFPDAYSADLETNGFLRIYKQSGHRKWALTRMEGLFEQVDLAYYLLALEREAEALQVVSFLSDNVQFSGNHNIWTPVCYGLGLKSRLHRLAGDCHFAAAALNRIVAHPINAALPRDVLLKKLAALPLELEKGFCDKSQKWSCHILARALASICYYRETGVPALPQSSWYSAQELEPLLLSGLEKLRERLQTA